MRSLPYILALIVTLAPNLVFADDNSCFRSVRNGILHDLPVLPDQITILSGLPQQSWASQTRLEEEFSRTTDTSKSLSLAYEFKLKNNGYVLDVESSFTPPEDQSANVFDLEQDLVFTGRDGLIAFRIETHSAIKADCTARVTDVVEYYFISEVGKKTFLITRSERKEGHSPKIDHRRVPRGIVKNMSQINGFRYAYQVRSSSWFGKKITYFDFDIGLPLRTTKLTAAPPLKITNPVTQTAEILDGISLDLTELNASIRFYDSVKDKNEKKLIYIGEHLSNEQDDLPREDWPRLSPRRSSLSAIPTVVGISDADVVADTLRFTMSGSGSPPMFINVGAYMTMSQPSMDGERWSIKADVESSEPRPKTVNWNAPPATEEIPYLKGSKYIQLDKVGELTSQVRQQISNMDRLQAAKLIATVVSQRITYDYTALNDGVIDLRTTEEILHSGKGVCQHYAALFTAVARSLGIPARIIVGYYLSSAGAGGHAWVEVKANPTDWVPIDPQVPDEKLDARGYIPVREAEEYESQSTDWREVFRVSTDLQSDYKNWMSVTINKDP